MSRYGKHPSPLKELLEDAALQAAANPPEDVDPDAVEPEPKTPGAAFIGRRRQYDEMVRRSRGTQVILMVNQYPSMFRSVPWYDALAEEAGLPSILYKADSDCATTDFLEDALPEMRAYPSFHIFRDGKRHITIEHEEIDVIEAWARAGDEPEGWPGAFGYADDGGPVPSAEPKPTEVILPEAKHVGVDKEGRVFSCSDPTVWRFPFHGVFDVAAAGGSS